MAGGKPFRLSIVSDVSDVVRGNKDIEGSFEDVADSLDDVARESADAGRDIARGLSDGVDDAAGDARDAGREIEKHLDGAAKSAGDSAERLERSFKDAFDEVTPRAKAAADDVAGSMRAGSDDAVRATDEFKDEARSNISEVASSFSGDMDSAVDLVQGTLGGLAANLGPAGLFGAAVLAGGIGLLKTTLEGNAEDAETLKQKVIELADELAEVGGNSGALDWADRIREAANEITDAKSWWEVWQDEPKTWLDEQAEAARQAGIDFGTWAAGMAGDVPNAEQAIAQLDGTLAGLRDRQDELASQSTDVSNVYSGHTGGAQAVTGAVLPEIEALEGLRAKMVEAAEATREGEERQRLMADAVSKVDDTLAETVESQTTYAEAVVDSLADAGSAWEDYTKDGVLNLDEYNAAIEKQYEAVEKYERNMVRASGYLSDEALNYVRSLGPEAAPLLEAFFDAPLEERERTAENWDKIGRATTDGYASGIAGITGATNDVLRDSREIARNNPIPVQMGLPARWQMQNDINALVWGLTAPPVQVRVRYGQSIE